VAGVGAGSIGWLLTTALRRRLTALKAAEAYGMRGLTELCVRRRKFLVPRDAFARAYASRCRLDWGSAVGRSP